MVYMCKIIFIFSLPQHSANTEVFYDTVSFPFQQERYGQEEEDRQWDSGGLISKSKKLPCIPISTKRKIAIQDGYVFDDHFRPTSTPNVRRKMPQVPTKGSYSRQSSIHEQEKFRETPESISRRGASLPPTPTKNTNIVLARLGTQNLLTNSLPRATGRQLPKPNVNHRHSKLKKPNLVNRTNSTECTIPMADEFDNYYTKPEAVSLGSENFNEDYNYAYQSTDNLQIQSGELCSEPIDDIRSSINANYVQKSKNNYFQDDYYFPHYNNQSHSEKVSVIIGAKRDGSPLTQQNTDSLESRDDELKDSFDTAVSSVSSSIQQLKQIEFSTAPCVALDVMQKNIINLSQYQGDHQKQIKALVPTHPVKTVAELHNNTTTTTKSTIRGQLQQQNTINNTDFLQHNRVAEKGSVLEAYDKYPIHDDGFIENHEKQRIVENQESVESYIEEETEEAVTNCKYILIRKVN